MKNFFFVGLATALSFFPFFSFAEEVPENLPVVAFWRFNEDVPYADSSGNGFDLNYLTRPVVVENGYARFLPDTKGYFGRRNLDCSAYSALTIEFFVRLPDYAKENMIFYTSYGWNQAAGFYGLHGGAPCTYVHDRLTAVWIKDVKNSVNVAEKDVVDSSVLGDHGWHHIAVVMDASSEDESIVDEMKIYIDGVLKTSSVESTARHTYHFRKNHFVLGWISEGNGGVYCQSYAGRAVPFVGDMDDVRITAAALTPDLFLKEPTISAAAVTDDYIVWTGDAGEPDWENEENWSGGIVPTAGAKVHIPPTGYVVLDRENPTAELSEIQVDGTVVFDSADNCLRADNVKISGSGRLLGSAPYWGASEISNRIWVVCKNLSLDEGGAINADGRGFIGNRDANGTRGPGGCQNSQDTQASAASHGGYSTTSPLSALEYGDPVYPITAGSGGYATSNDLGPSDGGGVVRIDASGHVVVDGTISANAQDLTEYVKYGRATGGSGGSVLIVCDKISGKGKISARGACSSGAEESDLSVCRESSSGAGGRVAIHYDAEVQTAEDFKDLVIEVQAGKMRSKGVYSFAETGYRMRASAGTLYLTDTSVITAENISNLRGRLVNAGNLVFDGDVTITNWVGIATDGALFKVNGDFVLSGGDARFEMGSVSQTTEAIQRRGFVSDIAPRLEVGGDFVITNAARFDVYCARTNDTQTKGAYVNVAGEMTMADGTFVYPVSHPLNGGSAVFNVNDFSVLEGAVFGMAGGGFSGGKGAAGYGPGKGNSNIGAGYGGVGGRNAEVQNSAYGKMYGDAMRPSLAGSGGGHGWTGQIGGGAGGGVLHVIASNSIHIAGSVIADGTVPCNYNNGSTGGSGGSVLFETLQFSVDDTAVVSAKGGDSGGVSMGAGKYTCAGGGGRIAVWTSDRFFYNEGISDDRIVATSVIPESFQSIFSVAGGNARIENNAYAGEDGTVMFVNVLSPRGLSIILK